MANSLTSNPITLDTFSSVIDFSSLYPGGMYIHNIEWVKPVNVGDTFKILAGGASGIPIFDEECLNAKQSLIRYYPDERVAPLYLTVASGVEKASGYISISLWRQ